MLKPKEEKIIKSPPPSLCDSKRVLQAVSILKQLNQKFYETKEKKPLLDDESENPIILQLTMKKIPPATMQKFIKVPLPNSILNDNSEVCLITGDLDKRNPKAEIEPDVLHFKELLKKENISQVNEVITLRQLRKEYKPFEARRQLCGAYDVFLCDKKIAGVLPSTLGKSFFKKRKLPIQINMQKSNLKEQIKKALSSTVFHVSCKGNSCASEVANLSMNDLNILSNINASIYTLEEELPGQWDNILGIYVKTPKSKAIPLYLSEGSPNDFNFSNKRKRSKYVTDELSTLADSEVKVFRDGRVIVKRPQMKNDPSEMAEDDNSSDNMVKDEVETEDSSSFPASSAELDNNGSDVFKKLEKKSKKRKLKLGSSDRNSEINENIENSDVKKEIEDPEVGVEIENSEVKKPKKITKKRKPNKESEVKIVQENIANSVYCNIAVEVENSEVKKPKKITKKRKPNKESEAKIVQENIANSVISMKRKLKKKKNQN